MQYNKILNTLINFHFLKNPSTQYSACPNLIRKNISFAELACSQLRSRSVSHSHNFNLFWVDFKLSWTEVVFC